LVDYHVVSLPDNDRNVGRRFNPIGLRPALRSENEGWTIIALTSKRADYLSRHHSKFCQPNSECASTLGEDSELGLVVDCLSFDWPFVLAEKITLRDGVIFKTATRDLSAYL
jgi:hypothetical protein